MYVKDGYDGRYTVSSAPSTRQFNMCVRRLRLRRAYLPKNREGGQVRTSGGSQCGYGPIDTPVRRQICGGISPRLTEHLNGSYLAAIAELENVLITKICL